MSDPASTTSADLAAYQDALRELPAGAGSRGLTLVGFMGVGKTTVGGELSRRLGWPLVDSDELVETQSRKTIREIFDWFGEPYFRDLEREVIAAQLQQGRQILSVGGGAFIDPTTRELLLRSYVVVYLSAPWSHVKSSIAHLKHTRPLLRTRSLPELEELFHARHLSYDLAHLRVLVAGRSPAQVADRILELLGMGSAAS